MNVAQALDSGSHSHSASDFALASVIGGSGRAVAAANAILGDFANETGRGAEREIRLAANNAKEFAAGLANASMNFAFGGDFKGAGAVPTNLGAEAGISL